MYFHEILDVSKIRLLQIFMTNRMLLEYTVFSLTFALTLKTELTPSLLAEYSAISCRRLE